MKHISREKFSELAKHRDTHCVSILIPTHRAGKEVNELVDQKHLKNKIKNVREELRTLQLKDRDIDIMLQPAEKLLEDTGFWSSQLEGLALFLTPERFEYYTLPVSFSPYTYISDHFYLLPLIPYLNDDLQFYLLALSLQDVKVYEGHPHHLNSLPIEELIPERLEEVVGFDYQQKSLQWRSGHNDTGQAMFHGHGAATDQSKKEIFKFFRAVNDGLMEYLYDKNHPLILAAVDYLVPIYRQANEYKHLQEAFIPGNPEYEKQAQLHQKAKAILSRTLQQKRREKTKAFEEALANNRASFDEASIIAAAINGRIDTLFIRKDEELWGIYDQETNQALIRQEKNGPNVGLMNLAAVSTIMNGGTAYILEAEDMPEPTKKLNALLRF